MNTKPKRASRKKTAAETPSADPSAFTIPKMTWYPFLPNPGVIVFPQTISPLIIDNPLDLMAITAADQVDRLIVIYPQITLDNGMLDTMLKDPDIPVFEVDERRVAGIGTLVRIIKVLKFPDGTARLLVRGLSRVCCAELTNEDGKCLQSRIIPFPEDPETQAVENVALMRLVLQNFHEIIDISPNFPDEMKVAMMNIESNEQLCDMIADTMNIPYAEKAALLMTVSMNRRLHILNVIVNRELDILKLGSKIQSQVHENLSKMNREHYLREQMDVIRKELGDSLGSETSEFRKKMSECDLSPEARRAAEKELERMEMLPTASSEYHVSANYLDWLLSIPWKTFTEDRLDVKAAAQILDADHYGLKDVKDRILEHLSVLQLRGGKKSPVLCFIGPPGVGKTSLGQSIAHAMNRHFVRMSLGGVRDEAEIRGHRRTYIGALPGRIVTGMKKAGCNNPVFMLDEIDKLGSDYHGDPASALLEVLDPQQNNTFNDHFLDLDYDLSSVFFIATANMADTIPSALFDRMEIIRLSGYTAYEKLNIAKKFLIPRQLEANGIDPRQLKFNDAAINEVISYYTCEAGVRSLERTFGTICRKYARKLLEGEFSASETVKLSAKHIKDYLGGRKVFMDEALLKPEVGVATGMAWTASGGSILPVEVSMMPGKGELKLTGSLGDVMKESAQTAFSFIRSHADDLQIDSARFKDHDFHIHVPDGATPKDGPSAGITLTTAMVSLLTNRKVDCTFAMTGEMTLRGKVTPVGGIKEKCMAALRSGISKIILPEKNRKDLEDIPAEIQSKIEFHFVTDAADVFPLVFKNG